MDDNGSSLPLGRQRVEKQLENLQKLGLQIRDIDHAREVLNQIPYYRLVKPYSEDVKDVDGNYIGGASFTLLEERYRCDSELRQQILSVLQQFEVTLRCRMANVLEGRYGKFGYLNIENYATERNGFSSFFNNLKNNATSYDETASPILLHFWKRGKTVPAYAILECISFGQVVSFFRYLKTEDGKEILRLYDSGITSLRLFSSWLHAISYLRNICAHYEKLFRRRVTIAPDLKAKVDTDLDRYTIFAILCCMRFIVADQEDWVTFVESLESIFDSYEGIVSPEDYGFIPDWKDRLLDQTGETADVINGSDAVSRAQRKFLQSLVGRTQEMLSPGDRVILSRIINDLTPVEMDILCTLSHRLQERNWELP